MAGPDPTRLERTQALFDAIAACDRADAEFILSGVLAEMGAGPPLPALRAIEEEAEAWAAFATLPELTAYFFATGARLSERRLGARGRMRLMRRLLGEMTNEERAELLR